MYIHLRVCLYVVRTESYDMIGQHSELPDTYYPRRRYVALHLSHSRTKYTYSVTCYMLELYNDKLLDLFCKPGTSNEVCDAIIVSLR